MPDSEGILSASEGDVLKHTWGWQEHKFLRETLSQKVEQSLQKVQNRHDSTSKGSDDNRGFPECTNLDKLLRTPNMVQNKYLAKMDARDQPFQKTNANMIMIKVIINTQDLRLSYRSASLRLQATMLLKQSRLLPGPFLPKE